MAVAAGLGAVSLAVLAAVGTFDSAHSAGVVSAAGSVSAPGCQGISVGPAQEAVSVATRNRLGLDVWPDTALGLLRDGTTYRFFATGTPGSRSPQKVIVTSGSLANPVAGGVRSAQPVANVPGGYDYAGGGPVFRDPKSGMVLEMLHLERPYGTDPARFYTELHLGVVDTRTGMVTRLGPIVTPHASYAAAGRTQTTIDMGVPSFSVMNVSKTAYLYVYFADASTDGSGRVSFTALSVARAPLSSVVAAARKRHVIMWHKHSGGKWLSSALGGAAADLSPRRPMAWAPDVARGAGRSVLVAGISPREMVLSSSADGVTRWSGQHPLFRDPAMFDAYPTLVGDGSAPSDIGRHFFVYYTQWQSTSPDWSKGRLMRRSVTCTAGTRAGHVPFVRYSNGMRHQVTTGPVSGTGYHEEGRWYLLSAQTPGTIPLYGCRNGDVDQYISKDAECGGDQYSILQTEGWIYVKRPAAPSTPLYRCHVAGLGDHFVSARPDCEAPGNANVVQEGLLGYALTR